MGGGFEALIAGQSFIDELGHAGVLKFAQPTGANLDVLIGACGGESFWPGNGGGGNGLRVLKCLAGHEGCGQAGDESDGAL